MDRLAAEPGVVDFRYAPAEWQTAICLPDDPSKSLVHRSGELLYHFGRGKREFGTRISVVVTEDARWTGQSLVGPRIPIVQTTRQAPGLTIVEEAFAVTQPFAGDDAAGLKRAINRQLWLPDKGLYAFFLDRRGQLETSSESLGQALAILFDVANAEQAKQIFQHQYVSPHGIPCSWPVFPRFGHDIGRHSGAVWPQIQGFWALAAAARGQSNLLAHELLALGHSALASGDFREIYHPQTGVPDGGLQTGRRWKSQPGQSWAATAYLAMLLHGVVGMRFEPDGIGLQPNLLERLGKVEVRNIKYRQSVLDIILTGHGTQIVRFAIDRTDQPQPWIPATLKSRHRVEIECIAAVGYPKHSEKTDDVP